MVDEGGDMFAERHVFRPTNAWRGARNVSCVPNRGGERGRRACSESKRTPSILDGYHGIWRGVGVSPSFGWHVPVRSR